MSKRKDWPDFSHQSARMPSGSYWTAESCQELIDNYSLNIDVQTLRNRLEDAGLWFVSTSANNQKPTTKESTKVLVKLADIGRDLQDVPRTLSAEQLWGLAKGGLSYRLLQQLVALGSAVEVAASKALSELPEQPSGPKKKEPRHIYVICMLRLIDEFSDDEMNVSEKARFIQNCSEPLKIYPPNLPYKTKIDRIRDLIDDIGDNWKIK